MVKSSNDVSFSSEWILQIPSAIALLDKNLKFIACSPVWLKEFDLTEAQVLEKDLYTIFPRFSKEWDTRLSYCLEGLKDLMILDSAPHGNLIWHLNPWKDGYGNIIGIILKVDKQTETGQLELQLRKTKSILDQKAKIAKIGSWEYTLKDEKLFWTSDVNLIYGVPKNIQPSLKEALGYYKEGHDRDTIKKRVEAAIKTGTPWNENLQLLKEDGTVIWVNTIGRPKFNNGVCTRIIGTVQDITEGYKKSQKKVKNNTNLDLSIFENVDTGLALSSYKTGKIIQVNSKLLEIMDLDNDTFYNNEVQKKISTSLKKHKNKITKQLKEKKSFASIQCTYQRNSKKQLVLELSGKLIQRSGSDQILLTTIKDITELYDQNMETKSNLKHVEKEFGEFIEFSHMVCHNLKAHSTNLSLLLNLINKEIGKSERDKLMGILFNTNEDLSKSIKGLRELVAIEYNSKEKGSSITINDHVFKTENKLKDQLKKHQGKIINEIPDNQKIWAVPNTLEDILLRIISNALKYRSDDKSPLIILSSQKLKDYHVIQIEDNGLGMDLDRYGKMLYEPFKTLNKTAKSDSNSQGLGLFFVKKQIEALGGKIAIESAPESGTTCKLYFKKS